MANTRCDHASAVRSEANGADTLVSLRSGEVHQHNAIRDAPQDCLVGIRAPGGDASAVRREGHGRKSLGQSSPKKTDYQAIASLPDRDGALARGRLEHSIGRKIEGRVGVLIPAAYREDDRKVLDPPAGQRSISADCTDKLDVGGKADQALAIYCYRQHAEKNAVHCAMKHDNQDRRWSYARR